MARHTLSPNQIQLTDPDPQSLLKVAMLLLEQAQTQLGQQPFTAGEPGQPAGPQEAVSEAGLLPPTRYSTTPTGWQQPSQRMPRGPLGALTPVAPETLAATAGPLPPRRAANESPITSTELPLPPAKSRFARRARATVAVTAVAAAGGAYLAITQQPEGPDADICSDASHALIQVGTGNKGLDTARNILDLISPFSDGRQWSEVADQLSEKRGYYVSGGRLAAANTRAPRVEKSGTLGKPVELTANRADGTPDDTIHVLGGVCMNIPAPLAAGQIETGQHDTVAGLAQKYNVTPATLRAYNTGLPKDDHAPLPQASVLWTVKKPDTTLVLQRLTVENLSELVPHTGKKADLNKAAALFGKILLANQAALSDNRVKEGDLVYAPLHVTDDLQGHGLRPQDIITAHSRSYNLAAHQKGEDQPQPEAAAPETRVPDAGDRPQPGAATAEQRPTEATVRQAYEHIDQLSISAEKKATLKQFVAALAEVEAHTDADDICLPVMLAQGILESGWGTSELATKYHNYFGMKANNGWDGPVGYVDTREHIDGKDVTLRLPFRAYNSLAESLADHIHKINEAAWYADARMYPNDPAKYLDGLLNQLDRNGNIQIAIGHKGAMSYATDPHYKQKILDVVERLDLVELVAILHGKNAAPATPAVPATADGRFHLDPSRYSDVQNPVPANPSERAYVDANNDPKDGKETRSAKLSRRERITIIERELNETHITPEGYEAFKKNLQDIRAQVKAAYPYFRGDVTGMGTPRSFADVQYFIMHFTATSSSATGYDGFKFAGSMHHSGHLGVQFNINDRGNTYWLTDSFVSHTHSFHGVDYNNVGYGVEISATDQSDVNSRQYESAVYLATYFLIEGNHVQKGTPFTPVLKKMIKGHREANAASGMHHDFPSMVMDPVRELITQALEQQGYQR